jgi:uncharacterized membrane protein
VYILGDLDSDAFKAAGGGTPESAYPQLEQLRATVEKRAGVMMLGGFHSFGPGGYDATPLARLLPIRMDPFERQRFDEKNRTDVHVPGPIKMLPAKPLGIDHPLLKLSATTQNLDAWNRLPPLDGANRFLPERLKPSAKVLAESTSGQPLLVAGEYGNGRVLAFAGDSTWRWYLKGEDAQRAAHKRFWRQAVLWLAHKETDEAAVWIKLEGRRFGARQPVRFSAGARTPEGEPIADAALADATLEMPGGKTRKIPLIRQADEMTGSVVDAVEPGDYTIVVAATKNGTPLGTARARFLVEYQDLELDGAAPDASLMENLARITEAHGGRAVFPEQIPALLADLLKKPKDLEIEVQTRWTLGGQSSGFSARSGEWRDATAAFFRRHAARTRRAVRHERLVRIIHIPTRTRRASEARRASEDGTIG